MNQAQNNTPVALVTGANKGIGKEAARQLAQHGFKVIAAARKADAGKSTAQEIQDNGGDAQSVVLDVTQDDSVRAAVQEVTKITPKLDVLVNNAGILIDLETPPRETDLSKLQQTFDTNVAGVARVTQAFLTTLKQSGDPRIVNVSSTWGSLDAMSKSPSATPSYHVSKAALNMWTVLLAQDLKPDGVSVNSICPGWVRTDMGGPNATRSVEQGAAIIVKLATMAKPPTGKFLDDAGAVAW